jgi:hypothetical protein
MKQESLYKMSPASQAIFNEWPEIADAKTCSSELIRRWYSSMDKPTQARADSTLRVLQSVKPMFWDSAK